MNSLKLILENNFFSFEDDIYLQVSGTAMGTKVAPTYASLVMGYLEEHLYSRIKDIFPTVADNIKNSWLRYLDDCWIIWNKNYGDHKLFYEILNNLHQSIKFTSEASTTALNFSMLKFTLIILLKLTFFETTLTQCLMCRLILPTLDMF